MLSAMKTSEFRRYLREQGCIFEEGKRHTVVRRGSRFSTLPRQAAKELGTGIVNAIKKQLGLK
jgi:mRNA interferase HicA